MYNADGHDRRQQFRANRHRGLPVNVLLAAVLLLFNNITAGRACTIVELQNDGFATNMLYLVHAIPIFYQQNGTLYIDNTNFPYNCAQDGGFHDFFKYDEHLVPWCDATPATCCLPCPCWLFIMDARMPQANVASYNFADHLWQFCQILSGAACS